MFRLTQTVQLDTKIQARNYYYHIAVGMALSTAVLFWWIFGREELTYMIPLFFLFGIGGTTLLLIGAIVLFEKRENILQSLIVTPLRPSEYINAKIISLSLLAILEATLIALFSYVLRYGLDFNLLLLATGAIFTGILHTLLGLILVVRHQQINSFLLPLVAIALTLQLPAANLFGFTFYPFYLIPSQGPLLLLQAAFQPEAVASWQLLFGFVASVAWIALFYVWALRAFEKHILGR